MVCQCDSACLKGFFQISCFPDVICARNGISGRMVMDYDKWGGFLFKRLSDDGLAVDYGGVHAPAAELFLADDVIGPVEE